MIGTLQTPRFAARLTLSARPFDLVAAVLLRYGLVLFLALFGLAKFTDAEAQTIQPWVANSPFLGWLYAVTSLQGASNLIGVVELIIALLLAVRPWLPRASVVGSLGAIVTFLITFSFLFTTPNVSVEWQGFLMKDVILVGAAVWTASDTLHAVARKTAHDRALER
jgi:uncharacterized membrane protein YkgB